MMRLALFVLCVLACLGIGCQPGSALCKDLQKAGVAVGFTDGQGRTWDPCTNQVTIEPQAEHDDGGAAGYCDPFDGDTACSTCMKQTSCPQLTACGEDTACLCHGGLLTGDGCTTMGPAPDTYTALASAYAAGCPMCPRLP